MRREGKSPHKNLQSRFNCAARASLIVARTSEEIMGINHDNYKNQALQCIVLELRQIGPRHTERESWTIDESAARFHFKSRLSHAKSSAAIKLWCR